MLRSRRGVNRDTGNFTAIGTCRTFVARSLHQLFAFCDHPARAVTCKQLMERSRDEWATGPDRGKIACVPVDTATRSQHNLLALLAACPGGGIGRRASLRG